MPRHPPRGGTEEGTKPRGGELWCLQLHPRGGMCELKAEQERSEGGGKSVSTNPRKRDARKYVHPHTELMSMARLYTAYSHQDKRGGFGWLSPSLVQRHSL